MVSAKSRDKRNSFVISTEQRWDRMGNIEETSYEHLHKTQVLLNEKVYIIIF